MKINIIDVVRQINQTIELQGWVANLRIHKAIIFIDLRDRSAIIQAVIESNNPAFEIAKNLHAEDVVSIKGKITKRPTKLVNTELSTGKVEFQIKEIAILNQSADLPFELGDTTKVNEEVRLKHRYLDLRSARLKKNLQFRHQMIHFIRNYLDDKGFWEIETPILTKSTPEGARDYLVPSRIDKGNFYALPQSPQQYKQLLMVAGVEKYFQIARCFRDEDTRGDRQPEFTQLDMEMSFVKQEDIMELNERLIIEMVQKIAPEKNIQQIPFPRITYREAMEKYQTDRPDLRKNKNDSCSLAFCWVVDFPFFEQTKLRSNQKNSSNWTFTHNPFSAPKPEHTKWLMDKQNIGKIITTQYDVVLNGFEVGGGSIRNHQTEMLKNVFEILGFDEKTIQKNFGHMLEAFSFGAPPHGGIAWGLDRWITLLQNEPNIREVIAFPKTGEGRDPMMKSPSPADKEQLKELGIKLEK